jgi:hypothetical protein
MNTWKIAGYNDGKKQCTEISFPRPTVELYNWNFCFSDRDALLCSCDSWAKLLLYLTVSQVFFIFLEVEDQ